MILLSSQVLAATGGNEASWEYLVRPGDSLWSFADQHLSSPAYVPRLQRLNHIADPYRLVPGSHIKVPYPWVRQHASSAQIEEFSGTVSAADASGKPLPINKEMRYPKGAQFQTGNDAMLRLRFEDGSTLLLNANASAQLQDDIYYPSTRAVQTDIRLEKGNAGSSVIPNLLMPSRYQIRTPSAITTVRGTEFRVNAQSGDSTATEVLRGKVNVSGSQQGQVDVPAGYGSMSSKTADPSEPEVLPAPPDLSPLPASSSVNPPPLRWTQAAQAVAYHVQLHGPGVAGQLLAERMVPDAAWFPSLPANGEYLLSARSRNAHGLEGYDSSQRFVLHAFPSPPLLLGRDGPQESRSRSFTLQLPASAQQPLLWQLSRSKDFATIAQNLTLTAPELPLTLPAKGAWYWRVARLDDKGQPGPYSDTQTIIAKDLLALLDLPAPALLARHYPVGGANYTLLLADDPAMQHVRYRESREQPAWPLQQLPRGHYFARLEVDGEHGYHAQEAVEEIVLP